MERDRDRKKGEPFRKKRQRLPKVRGDKPGAYPENRLANIGRVLSRAKKNRKVPRGQGPVIRSGRLKGILVDQAHSLMYELKKEWEEQQ